MEFENEMEIFITLTKYNTCLWRGEGNHCSWWLLSQHTYAPLTIVSNIFMRNGVYPLMFIVRVYNRRWGYNPGVLGNVDYPFIAKSTLANTLPLNQRSCLLFLDFNIQDDTSNITPLQICLCETEKSPFFSPTLHWYVIKMGNVKCSDHSSFYLWESGGIQHDWLLKSSSWHHPFIVSQTVSDSKRSSKHQLNDQWSMWTTTTSLW